MEGAKCVTVVDATDISMQNTTSCGNCGMESKKRPNMQTSPNRKKKYVTTIDSPHSADFSKSKINLAISHCVSHIRVLYGIIVLLVLVIMFGMWKLQQEIHAIRLGCQAMPQIHRHWQGIDNSSVELIDKLIYNWNTHSVRITKRDVRRTLQKVNKRGRRSDVATSLHEYCRTVHSLCDGHSISGPPGVPVTQGPPGLPGPKGDQGAKGDKGTQGRFGFDGLAGTPGSKGEPGHKGDRGLIGFTGNKGEQGSTGQKGQRGLIGPIGDKGQMGPIGPQGVKGHIGPRGPDGRRGKAGDRGVPGPKGYKGVDGIPGVPGFKGQTGALGERGPPGYGINCICEKGDKGDRGLIGFTGYKGDAGPRGPRGHGDKGERGPEGPPGRRGERGPKGDCDVWSKDRHSLRVVNVDQLEKDRQLKEIPQQDYQAPAEKTLTTRNSGARGSRSSGTNSVNLASKTISSFIPFLSALVVQFAIQLM